MSEDDGRVVTLEDLKVVIRRQLVIMQVMMRHLTELDDRMTKLEGKDGAQDEVSKG